MEEQLLDWAIELQALAQTGLTYTQDPFDHERFERIRTIATEILAVQSPVPVPKLRKLFADESGYPTPKLDTRAAIFENEKFYWYKKRISVGPCLAVGSSSINPSKRILLRKH